VGAELRWRGGGGGGGGAALQVEQPTRQLTGQPTQPQVFHAERSNDALHNVQNELPLLSEYDKDCLKVGHT
jgi:hypothetical protein